MTASKEAVLVIYNGTDHELIGIVKRDEQSRKVVIYACKEMEIDDIERLINKNNGEKI